MDAQAIVLVLGGIGGLITAGGFVYNNYKKVTAPFHHSAVLDAFRLLWNWLDSAEVNDRMVAKMREGGTIVSAIPERIQIPVRRVVDPRSLRAHNRASRALLEEDPEDPEEGLEDDERYRAG